MPQRTAAEGEARESPAGFELQLQETGAAAEGAAHHHLWTGAGAGGKGHQQDVGALIQHA